jgi:adenosylcobinamide-GDP ribazoletransferase
MHHRSNGSGWISALVFLTILPIRNTIDFNARGALPYFPVIGIGIGAALLVVDWTARLFWQAPAVALCDVLALVAISGALHLDGLADTGDGLYGHRSAAQRLTIMKDSRIGAMGMIAVICCLAVKWTGISSLAPHRSLWLLLVPAYARASVLVAVNALPYGRAADGTGHAFFGKPLKPVEFWALAVAAGISLSMGWDAVILNLGFAIIVGVMLIWYRHKLGSITGDMLGALIEVTEAGLFLLAAARWVG